MVLFVLFNAPILLLFNQVKAYFGFPFIYIYIFGIWFASTIISFVIFKKFDE